MKKYLFINICIVLIFNINAQNVQWGESEKLSLSTYDYAYQVFNKYLGHFNGCDYYTSIHSQKTIFDTDKVDFIFIKTINNKIIKTTESTTTHYNYINIQVINNEIAIFYYDILSKDNCEIKVDFFNLNDFAFIKTKKLFNFKSIKDFYNTIKLSVSEDNSIFEILTEAIDPESSKKIILIKTFDFSLNEKSETKIDLMCEGFYKFKNLTINNDGSCFFSIYEYLIEHSHSKFSKILLINCNGVNSNVIEFKKDGISNITDYIVFKTNTDEDKLIILENTSIKIYNLFFNSATYSAFNEYNLNNGNWIIDQTFRLDNENIFIALSNSERKNFHKNNSNVTIKSYKSINLLCFNSDFNHLVYKTKVNRFYLSYEIFAASYLESDEIPGYFLQNNNITIIYNNDPLRYFDVNDDDKKRISSKITKATNIQKTIIDEYGDVKTTIITDKLFKNLSLIPGFYHPNSDETITLAKKKGKQITFGTITQ